MDAFRRASPNLAKPITNENPHFHFTSKPRVLGTQIPWAHHVVPGGLELVKLDFLKGSQKLHLMKTGMIFEFSELGAWTHEDIPGITTSPSNVTPCQRPNCSRLGARRQLAFFVAVKGSVG